MKIALAQLNYHIGNFGANVNNIVSFINRAKSDNADIVVFSELSVCGYPPYDLLGFSSFINHCAGALDVIASHTKGIAVVVGAPERNPDLRGKPFFNTAYFIADGIIKHKAYKSLLPDYDVFDEFRYFEPSNQFQTFTYNNHRIALTICEDLWNLGQESLYHHSPMDELAKQGADLIINIAASPFDYTQAPKRLDILKGNAVKYSMPLVYVNQVGAQTSLIFDGGSLALDCRGNISAKCKFFEEDYTCFDLNQPCGKSINYDISDVAKIHDALILGIRDYFRKTGLKKAILGLSGGIDSAVTLVLAVKALGKDNVMSLLMPSEFSSEHSVNDAVALAQNLSSPYSIVPVADIYNAANGILSDIFKGLPFGIAEENLQARIRALLLMAYSNKFGNVLLNTSNKSEAAVGYGTLYGDMCGAVSVLGDVYKTQVYELARYINLGQEIIPVNTINKAPSAELKFDQKDSDSLPEYDILDKILFQYIENSLPPDDIIAAGYDNNIVKKVVHLVNTNEFKRFQCPPILRVSPKAFGSGRQIPIVAKFPF